MAIIKQDYGLLSGGIKRDTITGLTPTSPYEYECTNAVFAIGNPEADSYCMFGEVIDGVLNKYRVDTSQYSVSYTSGILSLSVVQSRPTAHLVIMYS